MTNADFIKSARSFYVNKDFVQALRQLNLTSIDAIFNFSAGDTFFKPDMARHRSRLRLELKNPPTILFIKRYDRPSAFSQLQNWFSHKKRAAAADYDRLPCPELESAGIATPKIVACGAEWTGLFEKRSFIITEKIPGESLEKKLPDFLSNFRLPGCLKKRTDFINRLADFVRLFHQTGFCHRDLYLSHIFMTENGKFVLIDLHRAFKPILFRRRFIIKDISQLYYSAPGNIFSSSDRLRFFLRYRQITKLSLADRLFIKSVKARAWRMADHDIRHNRPVPFAQ